MKREIITKGTKIDTIYGYEIVTGYNGSVVYTDTYEILDDEEPYKLRESMLTYSDINARMKEVDGRNHSVRYEEAEE